MFGPIRGDWPDDRWRGWWGNNPPYHTDVFILTHHARAPIDMEGGTTFHFVTEGVQVELEKARSAAKGKGSPAPARHTQLASHCRHAFVSLSQAISSRRTPHSASLSVTTSEAAGRIHGQCQ